jgi:CheY-like chemotaxis protein
MQNHLAPPKRILLVDDETAVRGLIKCYLENQGYIVAQANNGAEALSLFARSRFDLVVTDYDLPFMTGKELVTRIKAVNPNQSIVLMRGKCPEAAATGKAVDAVLCKPFELNEVGQTIQSILAGAELAQVA